MAEKAKDKPKEVSKPKPKPQPKPIPKPKPRSRSKSKSKSKSKTNLANKSLTNKIKDCGPPGPGPNKYKLPPVLGYPGHDITRYRNPAYSVGRRTQKKTGATTPGPKYDPAKCTRFGPIKSPAVKFNKRVYPPTKQFGPGPSHYNLQKIKDPSKPTPPRITIKGRPITTYKTIGPGPCAHYPKDTAIYPKAPSAKITPRIVVKSTRVGPAPNAYMPKYNGKTSPRAKITSRPKDTSKFTGPGPKYNPGYLGPRAPTFTFGGRPDPCVKPFIDKTTDEYMDNYVPNPNRMDVC